VFTLSDMKTPRSLIALLFLSASCADNDPQSPVAGDATEECEMLAESACVWRSVCLGADALEGCETSMAGTWGCSRAVSVGPTFGECIDAMNECRGTDTPCATALVIDDLFD
jgi:hypothetical protein